MTEIKIPKHIMRHEDAVLGCKFDLDGESLYSVKWYKDGFEFYRYVPRDMPPGQVFPLPGVDVEFVYARLEMSNKKSKLVQSLEESTPPIDEEDIIRLIADQIRQPTSDPVDINLSNKENLSILHLEDAFKFQNSMRSFHVSPTAESLNEVMPVKDEDLGEMLDALTDVILGEEDDGDDDDYEEEDEGDDEENEFDDKDADDLQNSTDVVVVLRSVSLQSTGRYRCEVSGEAPSFQTVSGHEDMIVVVTPKHGPQITGGQPRYQIGDMVRVNCTSAASRPVCHLSWLINGMHANRSLLRPYEPLIVGREGLEVARLGLEFRCVAKISSVYWQSNEESVESDKHQRIPVLESRETVMSKSRQSMDKAQLEDKQLKKSRRPAAATSAAAAAAASSSASRATVAPFGPMWGSSVPWSRILASKSIARISLYALPVLIAFLCSFRPAVGQGCSCQRSNGSRGSSTSSNINSSNMGYSSNINRSRLCSQLSCEKAVQRR
ncbi:GM17222 [Drosophila sechellia]|uniref:GM17222 n=1 Tax=Drosophila sechellia TaxID=7238 RepID=B4I577_DROSE|nr:GM17222 [Drosophila sechellia]